jgi:hypothetical protein
MGTITADKRMAKRKGRPRKSSGEGTPVRIDSDLVSKARYLAAQRDLPLSELLSDLLRPSIEREFRKAAKDIMGDQG